MWNNNPNNNGWNNRGRGGWGQPPFGQSQPMAYQGTSVLDRSSLIQKVMWFTGFSIVSAVAGVYFGSQGLHSVYNTSGGSSILWFILEIGLMIGAYALRERQPINFFLLYGFTFVTGVVIAPLMQLLVISGNSGIIIQALAITGALTFGLGAYAYTTKRDFSGWAPYLFVAVIGLVLVSVLNIFLHSTFLYSVIMYAGVLIFSCYLIFDVQQARKYQNTIGNAIAITIGIYLDILNIFLYIIQILISLQDNR